jgi:hypothetical protein
MNQTLINANTGFPSLFHIANANQNLPMPFAREIFLFACYIAGTNFRPEIAKIEPKLKIGAKFRLQREPKNGFDELAIAVYDADNNHLGYIPKSKNEVPARLLDVGKNLCAILIAKEWNDSWLKLDIEIFLND